MAKRKNNGADAPEKKEELATDAEVSGEALTAGDEEASDEASGDEAADAADDEAAGDEPPGASEEAKIPDSAAEPPAPGAPSAGADPELKPEKGEGRGEREECATGSASAPRSKLRERDEVDVEPISLPELPVAPLSKPGYVPRHLDVHLNPRQSEALRALYLGLDAVDARMLDGPHVKSAGDAVRFLLDMVAVQIERNRAK